MRARANNVHARTQNIYKFVYCVFLWNENSIDSISLWQVEGDT